MRAALEVFRKEARIALQEVAPEMVAQVQRELCLDLIDELARATPVDTGYLRVNWQLDRQTIPSGTIEDERLKARGKISGGDAAALAKKVLDAAGSKLADMTEPDIVHIINNVEYLIYLEDGRVQVDREFGENKRRVWSGSAQAPEGWISTILEGFRAQWSDLIAQKMAQAGA